AVLPFDDAVEDRTALAELQGAVA
ncbi:MAG: hypothetical protein K0R41_1176, partial [Geminicoccaceae bacterium]|nr:hypothetical protein [Geminicoccaceae bacterium]